MSQGYIGYHLQQGIGREMHRRYKRWHAATVVTQIECDPDDPAFANPTKPIGPFYTEEQAREIMAENPEMVFVEDSGRGWRRVVASPEPKKIVEADSILNLLDNEFIVIACGGGGIPVVRDYNNKGCYKGVAAVIAPWNFPFAIAMGMVSAAIVTGNPVVFKPSSLSSAIGYNLVEIFKEVGLPAGVFNYCPGQSSVMGDYLVEHPDISLICFTGSMDVGLHIVEKAAKVQPGQRQVKRVIAEMGGKNATIVDDDADLDEAVSQVVYSAFGFQGQKCSACSRVIVLDAIYDTFVQRLALAAQSLRIGPAENPENFLGPLADASLQKNVLEYIKIAEAEGKTLVKRSDLPDKGAYVPLLIVEDVMPEHRIAQEEACRSR